MASKALLSILLIISSSFVHISLCEDSSGSLNQLISGLGQNLVGQDPQCMQKLLPCQPFLKSPNNPPHACCAPLNEMVADGSECLCNVFNNPQLLQSFNVSQEDAMKLPEACDIKVDVSKCNNTETSTSSQAGASSSTQDSTGGATSEDSTSSTKMISPHGIIYFGVPGFVALLTALVFSAY